MCPSRAQTYQPGSLTSNLSPYKVVIHALSKLMTDSFTKWSCPGLAVNEGLFSEQLLTLTWPIRILAVKHSLTSNRRLSTCVWGQELHEVATPCHTQVNMTTQMSMTTTALKGSHAVCCRTSQTPPHGNVLYLNGQGSGLVNNACFPSAVAPLYAPSGQVNPAAT